jgi:hypothetical protein
MGVKVTGQFEPAGSFSIVDAKDVSGNITSSNIQLSGDISGSTTSTGSFGRLEIIGNSSLGGNLDLTGNITIGDSDTDSLTITADLTSNLIPNADSTFNLGSPTKNWKEGYIEELSSTNITASGDISGSGISTGSLALLHVSQKIGVNTLSPLATVHISASDGIIIPVGNTSQRSSDAVIGEIRFNSQLQTYEGYDGNNWGSLGGMSDVDKDTKITAETSAGADNDELQFFTAGTERLRILADGHISASGNITSSGNIKASKGYFTDSAGIYADKIRRYSDSGTTTKIVLNDEVLTLHAGHASDEVIKVQSGKVTIDGDVSASLDSTGSFGMIKKDGLDIREHFSRNLAEAFELDSNGDFQPSPMNKYIVDTRWDLDDNGDLQMRERELWTLFPDDYFSD